MSGNGAGESGVPKRVTRANVYEPAFGRLFHLLALTPDRVARLAIAAALAAYLVPRFQSAPHTGVFIAALIVAAPPALVLLFMPGRIAYSVGAVGIFMCAGFFGNSRDTVLVYFFGIGGAFAAIAVAARRAGRDDAFDNFDQFLSVTALAMCWSTLGAWLVNVDLQRLEDNGFVAPRGLLVSIALALPISLVSIVGDARRLIWLRRLRAGTLAGYAVKAAEEEAENADVAALPALVGGAMSEAVLVLRQSIPGLPFRSGLREIPVARVPNNLKRLSYRVGLRLFAVAAACGVLVTLAVLAVLPR